MLKGRGLIRVPLCASSQVDRTSDYPYQDAAFQDSLRDANVFEVRGKEQKTEERQAGPDETKNGQMRGVRPAPRLPAQKEQAQRREEVAGQAEEVVDRLRQGRFGWAAISFAGKERGDQISQREKSHADHSESSRSGARQRSPGEKGKSNEADSGRQKAAEIDEASVRRAVCAQLTDELRGMVVVRKVGATNNGEQDHRRCSQHSSNKG